MHTLIDRIVIHERERNSSGEIMRIDIFYRFIGNIGSESLKIPDTNQETA